MPCRTGANHVLPIVDLHSEPEAFGAFGGHEKLDLRIQDIIGETPSLLVPQPEQVDRILVLGRDFLAGRSGRRICSSTVTPASPALPRWL
ncbi:MAG: hypothetical protein M3Y41_19820 [Pseudomonadota bacterium]|nr:hypothetical protein [Pseudomonadota bacterium]